MISSMPRRHQFYVCYCDTSGHVGRRPLGGGLVELRHGSQAEHVTRYLQVSHTFQPSVPRLDTQLDQTTVSLAFNLEGDIPTQQQVYAFLPLRSYGLSFIVQVGRTSLMTHPSKLFCRQGRPTAYLTDS